MKYKMIAAAIALAGASLGMSIPASAQMHSDRGDMSSDHMRRDDMRRDDMRRDDVRRDDVRRDDRDGDGWRRGEARYDRVSHDQGRWGHNDRRWHNRRHCRTVWRHHHRVRRCW